MYCDLYTYPDPLPPTIATFLPVGTVKLRPLNRCWSSEYPKYTSSKVIVASCGVTCNAGAFSLF